MADSRSLKTFSVLIFALVCFGGFIIYLLSSIGDLRVILKEKDVIINNGLLANKKRVQNLTDTVKQYTEQYEYSISGKTVNTNGFIKLYNNLQRERDEYKFLFDAAKSQYGFVEEITKTKDKVTYSFKPHTRADSARITYSAFNSRISLKDGKWYADMTSKKDLKAVENDIRTQFKPLVDSAKKVLEQRQPR